MADSKTFSVGFWRAAAWTACYVFFMWAIMRGMFNFNIFSVAHWVKVPHVELHGFPGLVFGILLLAAVPLYVATTIFTVRNKETPVKFPMPKCFIAPPKPAPEPPKPLVVEQDVLPTLRPGIPAEMREVFAVAQKSNAVRQKSVFNRPSKYEESPVIMPAAQPVVAAASVPLAPDNDVKVPEIHDVAPAGSGLPIPTDFDTPSVVNNDVPVFSDIKFDDDDEDDDDEEYETPSAPEYTGIQEFLDGAGHKSEILGNLIITGKCAIAVHADDDFWVADDIDWFAAGRQKPSPIVELLNAKKEKDLEPILYLGHNNIMDLDTVSEKWRESGIKIVTNSDDLLKIIESTPK